MQYFTLSERLAFGSQPGPKDLDDLAGRGVKTVVNLRFPEEDEPAFPPDQEKARAEALGMRYVNIPVSDKNMNAERAALVSCSIAEAEREGLVFVHCKAIGRAGVCSFIHLAEQKGWSGEGILQAAEEARFQWRKGPLSRYFARYIDSRRKEGGRRWYEFWKA